MEKEFDFDPATLDISDILGEATVASPNKAQYTPPVEPQPPVVTERQATQAISVDSFSLDDSDLRALPGVTVVSSDAELSFFPVEKYKAKANQRDRISPLTNTKYEVRYHWDPEIKTSFMCFGGSCCAHLGSPITRFVRPVAQYMSTDSKGLITGNDVKLRVLVCNKKTDDIFQMINQQVPDVSMVDIVIQTNNEEYQDLQLVPVGASSWKANPEMKTSIMESWAKNKKFLFDAVGKTMNEAEYLKAKQDAQVGKPASAAQVGSLLS